MAINKAVNKSTKSHGAMRNVMAYVLRDEKVKEGHVAVTGPFDYEELNWDTIYNSFLSEKKLWNKDSGRMYAHNIISFHKDEKVTPEEVLEIGQQFVDKFFPGHQSLIGVHQDKDHLHCHIVTNSVSYIDGKKLHQTKRDLERQKEYTNSLCLDRGLSIAEKGKHFDGTPIEQGEITAWCKDKYNLLLNDSKKSYVAECAIAIMESVPQSSSREEFISSMEEKGWSVQWEDTRKHIVFQNKDGKKVRDSNIEKTFAGMEINKEVLTNEFTRQNEIRLAQSRSDEEREREDAELRKYYDEIESVVSGIDSSETKPDDTDSSEGIGEEREADTDTFIREIRAENNSVRDAETRSIASERERQLAEQKRLADHIRREKTERRHSDFTL